MRKKGKGKHPHLQGGVAFPAGMPSSAHEELSTGQPPQSATTRCMTYLLPGTTQHEAVNKPHTGVNAHVQLQVCREFPLCEAGTEPLVCMLASADQAQA